MVGTNFFTPSDFNENVSIALTNIDRLAMFGSYIGSVPTDVDKFATGCILISANGGSGLVQNIGDAPNPNFQPIGGGGGGSLTFGAPTIGYTPNEIVYVNNFGNVWGDVQFTRDQFTGDTNIGLFNGGNGITIGDINNQNNGTYVFVNDAGKTLWLYSTETVLGGNIGLGNNTYFTVDDVQQKFLVSGTWPNTAVADGFSLNFATSIFEMGDVQSNGNNTLFTVNDASQTYTLSKLGGGGTQMVVTDNSGVLGVQTIPTGTIGGTIQQNQVGYGSGVNTLTSDSNFLWDPSNKILRVGDEAMTGNQIRFSVDDQNKAILAQTPLGVFGAGDFSHVGNLTRLEIDDTNLRTDFYTQDFYVRGYNANVGIFAEVTNTYANITIGDNSIAYGGDRIEVENSVNRINVWTDGVFRVRNVGNTGDYLLIDPANDDYALGDLGGLGNHNLIFIQDDTNEISVRTPGYFHITDPSNNEWFVTNVATQTTSIGNVSGAGNDTILSVHDSSKLIQAQTDSIFKVINVAGNRFLDTDIFNGRVRFGDIDNATTSTTLTVDYSSSEITSSLNGQFLVKDQSTGQVRLVVDTDNIIVAGGDTTLVNNGFRFAMFDALKTMDFAAPDGVARFGDIDSLGNDTKLVIDDANMRGRFSTNGTFDITNAAGSATWLLIDPTAGTGTLGDVDNIFNSTQISWNDSTSVVTIQGTSLVIGMTKTRINGNLKQPSIVQHNYGTTIDYSAAPDFGGRSMIAVTGSTGATTLLLPTGTVAPIGTIITIKDHDCIGATSNIQLDAGTGSTINDTSVAQTTTINTNGGFRVLIKQTSNSWDVIGRG